MNTGLVVGIPPIGFSDGLELGILVGSVTVVLVDDLIGEDGLKVGEKDGTLKGCTILLKDIVTGCLGSPGTTAI